MERSNDVERLEATVSGTVQGVGFRWFVVRNASRLGLTGWVANAPDGTVRIVAEGAAGALGELELLIHDGPPGAGVAAVDRRRLPATGSFGRFEVRSGAHSGD